MRTEEMRELWMSLQNMRRSPIETVDTNWADLEFGTRRKNQFLQDFHAPVNTTDYPGAEKIFDGLAKEVREKLKPSFIEWRKTHKPTEDCDEIEMSDVGPTPHDDRYKELNGGGEGIRGEVSGGARPKQNKKPNPDGRNKQKTNKRGYLDNEAKSGKEGKGTREDRDETQRRNQNGYFRNSIHAYIPEYK